MGREEKMNVLHQPLSANESFMNLVRFELDGHLNNDAAKTSSPSHIKTIINAQAVIYRGM